MFIYLNGKYLDKKKSYVSSQDRGFLLGDGLFETMLYKDKKLILYDLHIKRLNEFGFFPPSHGSIKESL